MQTETIAPLILMLVKTVICFGAFMLFLAYLTLLERRLLGLFQLRYGPNRVGYFGLLQPLADGIKMLSKEDLTVALADRPIYILAPIVCAVAAFIPFAVIPFGNTIWPAAMTIGGRVYDFTLFHASTAVVADVDAGLLYVFAISSLSVFGLMMAGWSSNNKYSLLGGIRASAQMISYELAAALCLISIIMAAGSMNLGEIARAQEGFRLGFVPNWFCFRQPLAFVLFLIALFAETGRTPFDFTECDNELVAGYQTEYSSMKFALFYLAEYAHLITGSALLVTVFFGGWQGPFVQAPGFSYVLPMVYFCAKVLAVLCVFVWVRATYPRFRYDLLMQLGWKVLLPAALANILLAPFFMKLWGEF